VENSSQNGNPEIRTFLQYDHPFTTEALCSICGPGSAEEKA